MLALVAGVFMAMLTAGVGYYAGSENWGALLILQTLAATAFGVGIGLDHPDWGVK